MNVNQLTERPARYWIEDGMVDIFFGLQWLSLSIVLRIEASGWEMAALGAWTAATLASIWGLKRWKITLIAPRTGHVAMPGRASVLSLRSVAAMFGAMLICGAAAVWLDWTRERVAAIGWLGFGYGCFFAIYYAWLAAQYKMPRYVWIAGAAMCAAIAAHGITDPQRSLLLVLAMVGGALTLAGTAALAGFLWKNPSII
jgi:hypothetical protein